MVRLSTQTKNRLHAVLHRHHLLSPAGKLFEPDMHVWWLELKISALEQARVRCDLDTLVFAQAQIDLLEEAMAALAAQDERVVLLLQLPGVGLIIGPYPPGSHRRHLALPSGQAPGRLLRVRHPRA